MNPKKAHTFVMKEGIGKLEMTHTYAKYGLDPCSLTHAPRKQSLEPQNNIFLGSTLS